MVVYVGSASDSSYDQVLEHVTVSSLKKGFQVFELSVAPPDASKIPSKEDLLGVTLLMITVLYRRQEFFRCSYFVYNGYEESTMNSGPVCLTKVIRSILREKPRMRINEIVWDSVPNFDVSSHEDLARLKRRVKHSPIKRSGKASIKKRISGKNGNMKI